MPLNNDSDVSSGGPYNGEGTNPDSPVFFAFNLTPGAYELTIDADANALVHEIGDLPAGSVAVAPVVYPESVYATNPTGTWCTE
ncbi:hypothetical protein K8I61_02210 [bacterium]|nr:hypothetical protein [bacterium]